MGDRLAEVPVREEERGPRSAGHGRSPAAHTPAGWVAAEADAEDTHPQPGTGPQAGPQPAALHGPTPRLLLAHRPTVLSFRTSRTFSLVLF